MYAFYFVMETKNITSDFIRRRFLSKRLYKGYYSYQGLYIWEKVFFDYFYFESNFGFLSYFYIDWDTHFFKKIEKSEKNYLQLLRYLHARYLRKKKLSQVGLNFNYYKKHLTLKSYLKLDAIIFKNYFNFSLYHRLYVNGSFTAIESVPLYLSAVSFFNEDDKALYWYDMGKIRGFYKTITLIGLEAFDFNQIELPENPFIKKYILMCKKLKKTYTKTLGLYGDYKFFIYGKYTPLFLQLAYESTSYVKISYLFRQRQIMKHKIRFLSTTISKFLSYVSSTKQIIYFLRKNKIFNKGRYSRNRQLYRTGVYWCLWLNIIIVYGLYFFFYRFTFNFGYLWIGMGILLLSFVFSRAVQYKLYSVNKIYNEAVHLFNWCTELCYRFIPKKKNFQSYIVKKTITVYYTLDYAQVETNLITQFFTLLKKFNFIFTKKTIKLIYWWEYSADKDLSRLKTKIIKRWLRQVWCVVTQK